MKIETQEQYTELLKEFVDALKDRIAAIDESVFIEITKTQDDRFRPTQCTIIVNTATSGRDVYKVWVNTDGSAEFIRCM